MQTKAFVSLFHLQCGDLCVFVVFVVVGWLKLQD